MLIVLLTFLLISNALSLRKDKSILFSRIGMVSNALSLGKDKSILFTRIVMVSLITQIKGYFYINPYLSLSLAISFFSFAGVFCLIGFFAKQKVLSAALDNGYMFMALVAILTSVTSAIYYLNVIKNLFFFKPEYKINSSFENFNLKISGGKNHENKKVEINFKPENIVLSSALSNVIFIHILILLLFIYIPNEWFSIANILTLILFKP